MGCEEFLGRMSEYLDGELPERESAAFREHLVTCEHCRRERAILGRSRDFLLSGLPQLEPPPTLWISISRSVRRSRMAGRTVLAKTRLWAAAAAACVCTLASGLLLVIRGGPGERRFQQDLSSYAQERMDVLRRTNPFVESEGGESPDVNPFSRFLHRPASNPFKEPMVK